jgi:ABC-type transport system involved in multi-copper enzyme maturation permease subunit
MTAQSTALGATIDHRSAGPAMFLGFRNTFRKELTEWARGPKSLVIAGVSVAWATFATLLPVIEEATSDPSRPVQLSTDPTASILLGWGGEVAALIAVVATMALLTTERDRGTLAWNLANPVAPTSIIAAKFVAAMLAFAVLAVAVPLAVAVGVATIAYGSLPDLSILGVFAVLFLMLPAFYIGLTVALGTTFKSTGGVAGVALAVMFIPQLLGNVMPDIAAWSPTYIGAWVQAVATGEPAPVSTLASWVVAMIVLAVTAKLAFDREEL